MSKSELNWVPPPAPVPGKRYIHNKTKNVYLVTKLRRDSHNLEWLVDYEDDQKHAWSRKQKEWSELVDLEVDGIKVQKPRFEEIPDFSRTGHDHHWHLLLTEQPIGTAIPFYPTVCCECGKKNFVRNDRMSCFLTKIYQQSQGALGPGCEIQELMKKEGF